MRAAVRPNAIGRLLLSMSIAACPALIHAQDYTTRTVKIAAEACAPGTTRVARDAALRAAREEAVWLWLEGTLGQTRDDAYLPLMEYLETYTASSRLTNMRVSGGQTCVEAEIYLYEWPLRTDAATVLIKTRRVPPTVAFIFVENDEVANARRFQENAACSTSVVDALRSKGFNVVDPASTRSLFGERELLAMLEAGPRAMARFAADLNADAVISLESRLIAAPRRDGAGPLQARAELQVIVVSAADATVYEQTSAAAEVTAADAPTGLKFAMEDALYKLRDRTAVAAVLASRGTPADRYDLTIEGVRDLSAAEHIAQGLRAFEGVTGAEVLGARDGVARIRFQYDGRIGHVVDFLESGGAGAAMRAVKVVSHEMHFRLGA